MVVASAFGADGLVLREIDHFLDLPPLAILGIYWFGVWIRCGGLGPGIEFATQFLHQESKCLGRAGTDRVSFLAVDEIEIHFEVLREQRAGAIDFVLHFIALWRYEFTGGCAASPLARGGRTIHFRNNAMYDNECSRRDQARDLRVTKALQKSENIPIDRLLPELFARAKIAAHVRHADSWVDGGSVKGDQSAFGVTCYTDLLLSTPVEPIDPAPPAYRDGLVVTFLAAPAMY